MGIEELQKLPAEGIQAGLKGAGLRMWVDGERAKLMAQRDAQGQSLKAQREAESQRLEAEYEAEKEFQEKQIAMLNRQIAVLENLFKRKAAEVSSVIYMMEGHHKLEGIGEAGSEPRGPRREAAENIPVMIRGKGYQDDEGTGHNKANLPNAGMRHKGRRVCKRRKTSGDETQDRLERRAAHRTRPGAARARTQVTATVP